MRWQLPPSLTQVDAMAFLQSQAKDLGATPAGSQAMWVVDAKATQVIDSAALAVLMGLKRQALAAGAGFAVEGASASLLELARVYGVAEWLLGVK
jgi:phospholipid transport system transporter-binding protein